MKKYLRLRTFLLIALLIFIVMQFFRIDKANPVLTPDTDYLNMTKPPAEIAAMIKSACYDCHSNESKYPWYAEVAPISWIIKSHISEGRGKMNFSEWGNYQPGRRGHKTDECREMVEKSEMPLTSYKLLHPEARLTKLQKDSLVAWLTIE